MTVTSPRDDTADLPVTVADLHEMVLELRQRVTDLTTWLSAVLIEQIHRQASLQMFTPVLSPREIEIAALVAQGLSNPEIAQRLEISKRTVYRHVEHIFTKLGFTSRTQIAAWVVQTPPRARPVGNPLGRGPNGPAAVQQGCGTGSPPRPGRTPHRSRGQGRDTTSVPAARPPQPEPLTPESRR